MAVSNWNWSNYYFNIDRITDANLKSQIKRYLNIAQDDVYIPLNNVLSTYDTTEDTTVINNKYFNNTSSLYIHTNSHYFPTTNLSTFGFENVNDNALLKWGELIAPGTHLRTVELNYSDTASEACSITYNTSSKQVIITYPGKQYTYNTTCAVVLIAAAGGGGGGGYGGGTNLCGAGGGAGGTFVAKINLLGATIKNNTVYVQVGNKGYGGTSGSVNGTKGGDSLIGDSINSNKKVNAGSYYNYMQATGGNGGISGASTTTVTSGGINVKNVNYADWFLAALDTEGGNGRGRGKSGDSITSETQYLTFNQSMTWEAKSGGYGSGNSGGGGGASKFDGGGEGGLNAKGEIGRWGSGGGGGQNNYNGGDGGEGHIEIYVSEI